MPTLQETALAYFQSKGWTKEQAAGIVGNLDYESAGLQYNIYGDHNTAYGLAQWRGERQTLFYRIFGKPLQKSSFEEQLQFVQYELTNNYKSAGDALKKTSNIADATKTFMASYEQPANSSYASLPERVKRATQAAGSSASDIIDMILRGIMLVPSGGQSMTDPNYTSVSDGPFGFIKDNAIALLVGVVGITVIILGAYQIVMKPGDTIIGAVKGAGTKLAKA